MITAGIDIGSRSIELVVVEDGEIKDVRQTETGFDPLKQAGFLMEGIRADKILATGYGRNLFESRFPAETVTEIKACAEGAKALYPDVATILDIGGQDVKVIALSAEGKVVKFEMNDRCAAGTGKFMEIMAMSLGYRLEEFGESAMGSSKDIIISSMCTVFAESEVTSLLAKGEKPADVAKAVHASVARRAASMLGRFAREGDIFFAGGVAKNPCVRIMIEEILNSSVIVPENPQTVTAYGAARLAAEKFLLPG